MGKEIASLAPQALWQHFYEFTQISHPSKKEEKISAFVAEFGKKLGLHTDVDKMGNVLIRKPATPGMETRKSVVLQGHIDMVMVPQSHTGAIDTVIDGDWVCTQGTTLGADNGIGSAAAMAILESKDIAHPAIDALFTVDEETGMSGARALAPNWVQGDILINLDTEDDEELCIGCAGGLDAAFADTYQEVPVQQGTTYQLTVSGLKGGHSGIEIALGRANAIKVIARVLRQLTEQQKVQLVWLKAGELRNVIPSKAVATFVCSQPEADIKKTLAQLQTTIATEYALVEDGLNIDLQPVAAASKALDIATQRRYVNALLACPNDVIRMSNAIPGLVETSSNLAIASIGDGKFAASALMRSSVISAKEYLAQTMAAAFDLAGIQSTFTGGYPGWNPNINSPILKVMTELYKKMFAAEPHVQAIHAGLECGLLGGIYPNWDMISFGPTILNAHSVKERVQISSVEKWWKYLLEVLKNIPTK
ncbi:aminoacyl-histidine dipeptidase [Bacteroidia bacterium]|nr:aminoacyl-histidine dipeptidase [Bacteroidia bacterium]